jgi:spore coat protein U-like protein
MNAMPAHQFFLALLLVAGLALAPCAEASTTCTASMSNVSFGNVNPFDGSVSVNATIQYSCTITSILSSSRVRLCFSIGSGAQGDGSITPRRMTGTATPMSFNLFKDASYTQIWGTRADAAGPMHATMEIGALLGSVTQNASLTVYGRVPANQTALVPGAYSNNFSGINTELIYRYNEFLLGLEPFPVSCSGSGTGGTGTFPFTASASVVAACNPAFTVQNIDFGTHGLLTASIDTSATVAPQCTNTTPYQIGLDNGLYAVGNTRRMRSAGGRHVSYELYRDAGRSQRWGNTVNTDTVSATGDGSAQSLPIYARVAPQTTPPEGAYSDTVTVTIYY